jgi:phosphoserine phosphatase
MPIPDIRALWSSAKAVCFDVDSTVSPDEGIDVLAKHAGVGDEVAAITKNAMNGAVPFEEALKARLAIIRPSLRMMRECLANHPPRLTPGVLDLISRLERRGTHVYLVSGGFTHMVMPLAKQLGLPKGRVYANDLRFAPDGSYTGIDETAYTSKTGGKGALIAFLKERFHYDPIVMVGDGATDLEARPPADAFIGYGGVIVRDNIKKKADWFVTDFADLVGALQAPVARRRSNVS